ncbi:hypothetical protein ASG32_24560 [Methylobacterium sp. Leaf361]|uniref:hypothetical protein n=1 Tax=Methylobacterium sp. Leaf361 TaxID=1736352 RepID=UPI0006F90914|nr:hypothetical protein [Methylobacterium sp. Leaf361]KQS79835.1 hypothetical protein ASG32_24560 [Methylobacterium sp. Leaf361]
MANKHFVHTSTQPKAMIRVGRFDVPCTVLSSTDAAAHVRVLTTGGIPEYLKFVREGEILYARIAVRKQGPLGLDLWLDLQKGQDARVA